LDDCFGAIRIGARMRARDANPERRAASRRAAHADLAAEQMRDLARQGETEARAFHVSLLRILQLREILKDPLLVVGSDTDARIAHLEGDAIALGEDDTESNLAALGELDGVRDEVAQDLRELSLVGAEREGGIDILERQG